MGLWQLLYNLLFPYTSIILNLNRHLPPKSMLSFLAELDSFETNLSFFNKKIPYFCLNSNKSVLFQESNAKKIREFFFENIKLVSYDSKLSNSARNDQTIRRQIAVFGGNGGSAAVSSFLQEFTTTKN